MQLSTQRYECDFENSSDKPQFRIRHIRIKRNPPCTGSVQIGYVSTFTSVEFAKGTGSQRLVEVIWNKEARAVRFLGWGLWSRTEASGDCVTGYGTYITVLGYSGYGNVRGGTCHKGIRCEWWIHIRVDLRPAEFEPTTPRKNLSIQANFELSARFNTGNIITHAAWFFFQIKMEFEFSLLWIKRDPPVF